MTDQVTMSAITGAIGLLTTCFTGFMAYKMAQLKVHAEQAAKKVEEVRIHSAEASKKVDSLHGIAEETLIHVNGQHTVQLRLYAEMTRTVAELRGTQADREKAEIADKMYNDQVAADKLAARTIAGGKNEPSGNGK